MAGVAGACGKGKGRGAPAGFGFGDRGSVGFSEAPAPAAQPASTKLDAEDVTKWITMTHDRVVYGADDECLSGDEADDYYEAGLVADYRTGGKVTISDGSSRPTQRQAQPSAMQPISNSKVWSKISTDHVSVSHSASKSIAKSEKLTKDNVHRDKSDRATSESVMDPRTRIILFKLVNAGWLESINGCVSTGKEANVYHATGKTAADYAIKVYKTSILVFKDRDKYVSGEFRFRNGYCKSNPRKMVRTWAEKECRNLKRLAAAGIPCPTVEILRQHVLVMSFIGRAGWPAPRLKDAVVGDEAVRTIYVDLIKMMRTMFHTCRLVHADLSEFNILYMNSKIYIIDVSQSVEHDHPFALDFLRKDCTNVTEWFRNRGLPAMRIPELFTFVIDATIKEEDVDTYLDAAMERTTNCTSEQSAQQKADEDVFMSLYLPRSFSEIGNIEAWQARVAAGDQDRGVINAFMNRMLRPDEVETDKPEGSDEEGEEDEEEEEDDDNEDKAVILQRADDETPDERRERKKLVKEMQAAKRKAKKEKMPKHLKKRKEKAGKK
ncbi:Serine/threonine-protein kinase rio1 [Diplonema papillatum]|nr:Serine/threonine-protein kinase rio1 [Diplonema papillatum]